MKLTIKKGLRGKNSLTWLCDRVGMAENCCRSILRMVLGWRCDRNDGNSLKRVHAALAVDHNVRYRWCV